MSYVSKEKDVCFWKPSPTLTMDCLGCLIGLGQNCQLYVVPMSTVGKVSPTNIKCGANEQHGRLTRQVCLAFKYLFSFLYLVYYAETASSFLEIFKYPLLFSRKNILRQCHSTKF